jgi:hypothetical protein
MLMKQQGNTTVTGGIRGNNNRISTKNVQIKNVTNNNRGHGRKGDGEDGLAILFGVAIAGIAAAYLYLRHYDQIFFWLNFGAILAGIIHVAAVMPQYRNPDFDLEKLAFTAFGVALVTAQMLLIKTIEVALPPDVFRIAAQATVTKGFFQQAFEVWNRFNNLGHRLIMENVGAVVLLVPGLFLNLLYGIKCLSESIVREDETTFFDWLSEALDSMKIKGSLVSALFTMCAYLLISGTLMPGGN